MAKNIILSQIKDFRGTLTFIVGEKEDEKKPATVKDSIEGFLIFLHMNFRATLVMDDWKLINRINKRILDSEKSASLRLEDNEYEWLKKKLEEVPPKGALNKDIETKNSYGGLAFGADVIPVLEALDNISKD